MKYECILQSRGVKLLETASNLTVAVLLRGENLTWLQQFVGPVWSFSLAENLVDRKHSIDWLFEQCVFLWNFKLSNFFWLFFLEFLKNIFSEKCVRLKQPNLAHQIEVIKFWWMIETNFRPFVPRFSSTFYVLFEENEFFFQIRAFRVPMCRLYSSSDAQMASLKSSIVTKSGKKR